MQLSAETFETSNIYNAHIEPAPNKEINIRLGIADSLALFIPEDKSYMEGIELKFVIPDAIAHLTDSVLCSIYKDLDYLPEESVSGSYIGNKVFTKTLPSKLSWVVQIPLKENNSIKSSNYIQTTDTVITSKNDVIVVQLQPVTKDIDVENTDTNIDITVKPILINKGKLSISVVPPEDKLKPCSIFIDDEMLDFSNNITEKDVLLQAGIHDISILSEHYRNELRTVIIEQATNTKLVVEMKSIEPTLIISVPEITTVFLDNTVCNLINKEFKIAEGMHTIKFIIGNYEIVRTIEAVNGKYYKAVFSLDLQITEE